MMYVEYKGPMVKKSLGNLIHIDVGEVPFENNENY